LYILKEQKGQTKAVCLYILKEQKGQTKGVLFVYIEGTEMTN